jgi:malate synthase
MIGLRVPVELRRQLEERAVANHRNLSQECQRILERSFSPEALFVDCVAALEAPANRLKRAGEFVRDMAEETYGPRIATIGCWLMRTMAMVEAGGRLSINAEDIRFVRNLIMDLERKCEVIESTPAPALSAPAQHVRNALAARIATGEWKANMPVPSPEDLAREFGVSLDVVNDALDRMEVERLLSRRTQAAPAKVIYLVGRAHGRPGSRTEALLGQSCK